MSELLLAPPPPVLSPSLAQAARASAPTSPRATTRMTDFVCNIPPWERPDMRVRRRDSRRHPAAVREPDHRVTAVDALAVVDERWLIATSVQPLTATHYRRKSICHQVFGDCPAGRICHLRGSRIPFFSGALRVGSRR